MPVIIGAETWLSQREVAELLGIKPRHFAERVSKQRGFPKPLRFSTQGYRRWRQDEVIAWKERQRA